MSLRIEVQAEGDGTRLNIEQSGYQSGGDWDWYYSVVTQAWPTVLQTLKGFLETGPA
jgi:hypothetical protein